MPIRRPAPTLCRVVAVDVVTREQIDTPSSASSAYSFVYMSMSHVHWERKLSYLALLVNTSLRSSVFAAGEDHID